MSAVALTRVHPMLTETLLGLAEAAKRIPPYRGGRPTNASTVWRWIRDGVKGHDGKVVKLEAVKIVTRWCTSAEALDRFLAALQPPESTPAPAPRTPTARKRAADRASRELQRMGA